MCKYVSYVSMEIESPGAYIKNNDLQIANTILSTLLPTPHTSTHSLPYPYYNPFSPLPTLQSTLSKGNLYNNIVTRYHMIYPQMEHIWETITFQINEIYSM